MSADQGTKSPDPDRYKELFKQYDTDKNGYLSISEFRNLLKTADSRLPDSQIADFFVFLDGAEGDRRLTYEEFSKGLDQVLDYHSKARALFNRYDKNGDGFLDKGELRSLLTDLGGGKLSDSEMDKILLDADTNQDGRIALDEFLESVC